MISEGRRGRGDIRRGWGDEITLVLHMSVGVSVRITDESCFTYLLKRL